jgi:hypothetical protein
MQRCDRDIIRFGHCREATGAGNAVYQKVGAYEIDQTSTKEVLKYSGITNTTAKGDRNDRLIAHFAEGVQVGYVAWLVKP